jgi:hypothetical protein
MQVGNSHYAFEKLENAYGLGQVEGISAFTHLANLHLQGIPSGQLHQPDMNSGSCLN